jgi:hypothetical protein
MLKKTLILTLSLLMVAAFAVTAVADEEDAVVEEDEIVAIQPINAEIEAGDKDDVKAGIAPIATVLGIAAVAGAGVLVSVKKRK